MEKDTSQIELNLESHVNIRAIDSRRPPKSETTIGDLVQSGSLGIGELLELHLPATKSLAYVLKVSCDIVEDWDLMLRG